MGFSFILVFQMEEERCLQDVKSAVLGLIDIFKVGKDEEEDGGKRGVASV